MSNRLLMLGATAGWGHMQAAYNIKHSLEEIAPNSSIQIECIDVFRYSPLLVEFLLADGWRFLSRYFPAFYGTLHRSIMQESWSSRFLVPFARQAAFNIAEKFGGDIVLVLTTHPFATLVGAILKEQSHCFLCTAVTDFQLNKPHFAHNVDILFAPHTCAPTLQSLDLYLRCKVEFLGIPVSSRFRYIPHKHISRKRLALHIDRLTILMSFGGSGLSSERHLSTIGPLLASQSRPQILFVSGHNESIYKKVKRTHSAAIAAGDLKLFDFYSDIVDLYAAADVVIGKAGGLTVSECAATQRPLLIVSELPGQEEINAEIAVSVGVGQRINSVDQLLHVLNQPSGFYYAYSDVSASISNPDASDSIAYRLLDLLSVEVQKPIAYTAFQPRGQHICPLVST